MATFTLDLTNAEKLQIAKDTLHALETDYFRLSLMDPATIGGPDRLTDKQTEIETLQKTVSDLEAAVEADAPPPVVTPDPATLPKGAGE